MSLLEKKKGEKVHTRNVEIATYDCEDNAIIVEGILKDDRLHTHYTLLGNKYPPLTLHHMKIRLMIDCTSLIIKDVEAEMPAVPEDQCPEAMKSISDIKGLKLTKGFTAKVKKILGGTRGCSHLTTLLLMMAPAALQGYFTNNARKPFPKAMTAEHIKAVLGDTCHAWRNDGPLMEEVFESLNKKHQS